MARSHGHNWLDKAISETAPGQPPKPNFQTWRKAHAGALHTLKQRAQQRPQGSAAVIAFAPQVLRSPVVRLAVAAALATAVFLFAKHLVSREAPPSAPNSGLVQRGAPTDTEETTKAVLARVDQLCEDGDIEGLLALLRSKSTRVEVRIAVVERIGKIGDRRALPVLEQLASQWQTTRTEGPVRQAVNQIRQRELPLTQSASSDDAVSGTAAQQGNTRPSTLVLTGQAAVQDTNASDEQAPADGVAGSARLPVEVQTVDKTTGTPLEDVLVRAVLPDGSGTVIVARTEDKGQCVLSVPPGECQIVAQGWKNGRFESFSAPLTVRAGGTRVRMYVTGRTKVMGRLTDPDGRPVQGAVQLDGQAPVSTDPRGWFAVDEPFGEASKYHVLWAYDHPRRMGRMVTFRMADYTDALTVALEPCATVVGRVVDSQGVPVANAKPQLAIDKPDGTFFCYGQVPWTLSVHPGGAFAFTNVPVGLPMRVNVEGRSRSYELGEVDVAHLLAGQTVEVGDIAVRDLYHLAEDTAFPGVLAGTVTDENGKPVVGVQVRTEWDKTVTDTNGRYTLTRLPVGVRLYLEVFLSDLSPSGYGGSRYKYVYASSADGDVRVALQGWELLGKKAPPLSVTKWFDREPVTLEQLRGKVVLLGVGALWPGANSEFQELRRMSERYSARGLEVIAVHHSLDVNWRGPVTEGRIQGLSREQGASMAVCLDDGRKTWTAYRADVTPTFYLIDKQGYVRESTPPRGLREQWIETLLAE